MTKIRTRFAPSPTGKLHIGGARTALFNYIFAKHYNGDFILRCEDTDTKRNIEGLAKEIAKQLEWLEIKADSSYLYNSNLIQSNNLNKYKKYAFYLLENKLAYKAYDNQIELEKQKDEYKLKHKNNAFRYDPNWLKISDLEKQKREAKNEYVIRLKLNTKDYHWNDLVRGDITIKGQELDDFVILKNDKYPTYNFSVVIDDHEQEISHILRGEEHITNTAKQIALYEAFKWNIPKFGHLTIIVNEFGQKLSKRDQKTKQLIEEFIKLGYPKMALFNYLTLLGWNHKDSKEKMPINQIIKDFDPTRFVKSPSQFDQKKLDWFAKEYFQEINDKEIIDSIEDFKYFNDYWIKTFLNIYKPSSKCINDLKILIKQYLRPDFQIKDKELLLVEPILTFKEQFKLIKNWSIDEIEKILVKTQQLTNINGKNFFMPIRQATTYNEHGPKLATAIFLFGQDVISKRLGNLKT